MGFFGEGGVDGVNVIWKLNGNFLVFMMMRRKKGRIPERMHRVVSTLLPSITGGVSRSMTVMAVSGYRLAMARAVDRPNMPAPIIMTDLGMGCGVPFWTAMVANTVS